LAKQCEASFISIKGPELLSKWVGESEKGVREIFRRAKQAAPCIIFFDEIDSFAARRGQANDGNVGDRVMAQLLTEMDGVEGRKGVIILAATNRPELVDPALLRPGRFDLTIELQLPDETERAGIFTVHLRGRPVAPEVTIEELASLTAGRSGADIEAVCRRAALLALREWITPNLGQVRITQVNEEASDGATSTTEVAANATDQRTPPSIPTSISIRMEHLKRAIEEQQERYAIQEAIEEDRKRQERGRQRLIEMAADSNAKEKKPLRGFWLWLARIFGFVQ
jgi:transitional endoplasmic reticulum ATPase